MVNLISISGKINSGKDAVGSIIQYLIWKEKVEAGNANPQTHTLRDFLDGRAGSEWQIRKFAYKLKQIVSILTGCKLEDLESQEFKNRKLGGEWGIPTNYAEDEFSIHIPTYREILQRVGTEALRNIIHQNIWVNALFADYSDAKIPIEFKNPEVSYLGLKVKEVICEAPASKWIITDTRFENELSAIKERGGLTIRVNRPIVPIQRKGICTFKNDFGQFVITKDAIVDKDVIIPQEAINKIIGNEQGDFYWQELPPISNHPSETSLDDATFDYVIDNDGTLDELVEKVRQILIKEKLLST